ncbi:NUDIX domain-containing protein [Candidatus Saccharibacteria bacterium]|nr:NUDIX domain-containing protein [Candidatus Saccharibacteria bacterium]
MEERASFKITVGGIIEQDGKILLVQELKPDSHMKWWLPIGHLEYGETLQSAVIREIKEETGFDIELTGVLPVLNNVEHKRLRFMFTGKITGGSVDERNQDETNAVKFFSVKEIEQMVEQGEIRFGNFILLPIREFQSRRIFPLEIINDLH